MAIVAATPAANEPATTEPDGSRTGSPLRSTGAVSTRWGAAVGDGSDGVVVAGAPVLAGVVTGAPVLGGVVVGGDVDGGTVVGGGNVVGDGAGPETDPEGLGPGVTVVGRRRVQPGSIQCGSVSVTPPGWARSSLSWKISDQRNGSPSCRSAMPHRVSPRRTR